MASSSKKDTEVNSNQSQDLAQLEYKGKQYPLNIITGTDGQAALDLRNLHKDTKLYGYDPMLTNIALTESSITCIDSKNNKLLYRGYDIEDLVKNTEFIEVAYLLIQGELPNSQEYKDYSLILSRHSMIHESMRNFFDGFPGNAHPLAILATMVTSLSSYYPSSYEGNFLLGVDIKARLLSKVRTLAAWAYKRSCGQPIVYPQDSLPYCKNFLNMMFSVPAEEYEVSTEDETLLNQLLILYSDHEQNIATSTVRLVASSQANLFVSINAGVSTLWGARESASEVHAISMLKTISEKNMKAEQFFEKFINGKKPFKSSIFGHKKYLGMEPRAKIAQRLFHDYLKSHPELSQYPLINAAREVEDFILGSNYFIEGNLLPNLDFYSAILFQIMKIPESMFNVIRVIGKLAGWLAHWDEQYQLSKAKNHDHPIRAQQIYSGRAYRPYVPLNKRK